MPLNTSSTYRRRSTPDSERGSRLMVTAAVRCVPRRRGGGQLRQLLGSRSAPPPPLYPVESKSLCHINNGGSFGTYPRPALLDTTRVLANAVQLAAPQGYMMPLAHTHARPYNKARAVGHCGGLPEDLTHLAKLYNTRPAAASKVSSSKVNRSESRIAAVSTWPARRR